MYQMHKMSNTLSFSGQEASKSSKLWSSLHFLYFHTAEEYGLP